MIHHIKSTDIRDHLWECFLLNIHHKLDKNAHKIMDGNEIEPLIFTREVEDKHFQLENLRMELWK